MNQVKTTLSRLLEGRSFDSFRITANRADKRFPVKSDQINRDMGQYVKDLTGARVELQLGNGAIQGLVLDVDPLRGLKIKTREGRAKWFGEAEVVRVQTLKDGPEGA